MSSTSTTQEKGFFARIEKWGNKIPHAAYLFLGMSVIVALCSVLFSMLGTSAVHPVSGEVVTVNNLLTASSIADFLKNMGNVWMSFAPSQERLKNFSQCGKIYIIISYRRKIWACFMGF